MTIKYFTEELPNAYQTLYAQAKTIIKDNNLDILVEQISKTNSLSFEFKCKFVSDDVNRSIVKALRKNDHRIVLSTNTRLYLDILFDYDNNPTIYIFKS